MGGVTQNVCNAVNEIHECTCFGRINPPDEGNSRTLLSIMMDGLLTLAVSTTYAFEDTLDVGIDNLESLGIFRQLFFNLFRPNEQRLQIRPRPLDFLENGEYITVDCGGGNRRYISLSTET